MTHYEPNHSDVNGSGDQPPHRDPDVLGWLYHDEGMSMEAVGDELGVASTTILKWMRRHDIPRRPKDGDRAAEDRFWEKVEKGDEDECWEWKAYRKHSGYGMFRLTDYDMHAHRAAYILEVGDPGDLNVLHHCDNPPCVNPEHLYAGDQSDNNQDAYDRKRRDVTGENNARSKLTEGDVREIKNRLKTDETQAEIADEFGITQAHVSEIKLGKKWGHIDNND